MPRQPVRLLAGLAAVALMPVAVMATATAAEAGNPVQDPSYDFDCDDERDAVTGDQYADVDGQSAAGAVSVQYAGTGDKVTITQATEGVPGGPENEDYFGDYLTAYDENGDGCDDLVVGVPNEDVADSGGTDRANAGMVWIIPGSPSGLDPQASQAFHQNSAGIPGSVAEGNNFGRTLTAGTTVGQEPYLFIGAPGMQSSAGAAYYRRGGVTTLLTQDSPGVSGAAEAGDAFGFRISASDNFIAISSMGEQVGAATRAGMVHVFGFDFEDGNLEQLGALHQDSAGISGTAENGDNFGLGLSIVSYRPTSNSSVMPLVSIGAPNEDIKSVDFGTNAGLTHLVSIASPGTYRQISALDEGSPGVPGDIAGYDGFGTDTVLAVRGPGTVGTPSTTSWVVAASEYDAPNEWQYFEAMVFGVTDDPAADAKRVKGDDFGLPVYDDGDLNSLDASSGYLYFNTGAVDEAVYGVPWGNILDGENQPTVVYKVESA